MADSVYMGEMTNALARRDDIDRVTAAALLTVAGDSKRVYEQTYGLWKDWSHNNRVSPLDLNPVNVNEFLIAQHVTRATRKRQLSAMRKLVQVALALTQSPALKFAYEVLKMAKIPLDNLATSERNLKALSPDEANRLLEAWPDDSAIHVRNRALIALLLATGLRRAEAVALEWRDVDLLNATITVRHGKGDKHRIATIVGDFAPYCLDAWREFSVGDYVFPPMDNLGVVTDDRPMSADNLYRIIKQTERITGVEFSPHDLRRSIATELLTEGAPLADVQAQLGHAAASTTLRYAKASDAQERRKRFKTRYG